MTNLQQKTFGWKKEKPLKKTLPMKRIENIVEQGEISHYEHLESFMVQRLWLHFVQDVFTTVLNETIDLHVEKK